MLFIESYLYIIFSCQNLAISSILYKYSIFIGIHKYRALYDQLYLPINFLVWMRYYIAKLNSLICNLRNKLWHFFHLFITYYLQTHYLNPLIVVIDSSNQYDFVFAICGFVTILFGILMGLIRLNTIILISFVFHVFICQVS